jgi:hypothetical protein
LGGSPESDVELLESTLPDGPVSKYIEKKAKEFSISPLSVAFIPRGFFGHFFVCKKSNNVTY